MDPESGIFTRYMTQRDLPKGDNEVLDQLLADRDPVDGMAKLELLCQMEDIEAVRE